MGVSFIPHRLTVPFEELDGSPEERITSEWAGDGATRRLKCLSRNRIALERELLGYIEYLSGNTLIHLPASFGIDRPNLIATNVVTRPFGRVSGVALDTRYANYDHSILNITYEVATRIPSERYGFITLSEELRDTTELVTVPTKNLYWGTGGSREEIVEFDAPSKISHGEEWIYTISGAYRVPTDIFDHVGKINISTVSSTSTGRSYASGTLLYAAPTVTNELTFSGAIYRIALRFLHKNNGTFASPRGWNWFPRPSLTGASITYEPIYDGSDNAKIFYVMTSFRDVFV